MTRDVRWYLVGSLVFLVLAGCGGLKLLPQRDQWRREAELRCLKSGIVKQGPAVAMLSPIAGPGICGTDFPLKVAALGHTPILGYSDEPLRPPGAIRGAVAPSISPPRTQPSGARGPLDLNPPGLTTPRFLRRDATGTAPHDSSASPSYRAPGPNGRIRRPSTARTQRAPVAPRAAASPYPPRFPTFGQSVAISPSRMRGLTTRSIAAKITPPATLSCPVVSALDRWVSEAIQPAALRWFGQPVVEIKQISAYACRGMNGNPRARISEHAFGNALDISSFKLAGGHVVSFRRGWRGTPEEQGFLRDVQGAACRYFSTVLAPGSNRFHYDHIHVDLMRRKSRRQVCDPKAVSGEVIAARARQRGRHAKRHGGDLAVTGSLTDRRGAKPGDARLPAALFEADRNLPRAVPGED